MIVSDSDPSIVPSQLSFRSMCYPFPVTPQPSDLIPLHFCPTWPAPPPYRISWLTHSRPCLSPHPSTSSFPSTPCLVTSESCHVFCTTFFYLDKRQHPDKNGHFNTCRTLKLFSLEILKVDAQRRFCRTPASGLVQWLHMGERRDVYSTSWCLVNWYCRK